jgi:xylan 1,4-beta-xylosidase
LDTVLQDGVRNDPDVGSVAALDTGKLAILVWHYHDDDLAGPDAVVHIDVRHLPRAFAKGAKLVTYLVDRDHSNSYAAWLKMGSPIAPTNEQRTVLLKAAQLATLEPAPADVVVSRRDAGIDLRLPRQGVSLLLLTSTHP